MVTRSPRSVTALVLALVIVVPSLALVPTASAGSPEVVFDAAYNLKNAITGFDLDAQGRYAAVVVSINPAAGGALGPQDEQDVYLFDITSSGSGLVYGERHLSSVRATQVFTEQAVDFADKTGQSTAGAFFVGGPGNVHAGWQTNSQSPQFDKVLPRTGSAAAVAASGDGTLAAFALNTQASGHVYVTNNQGTYKWELNVTDTSGSAVKVTALAFARDAKFLVIGHEKGVWFVSEADKKPTDSTLRKVATTGSVKDIDVSVDGNYVVVGTDTGSSANTGYVYYYPMERDRWKTPFNRGFSSPVASVTMTNDGRYFAVGTKSSEVHFLERAPEGSGIAQFRPDADTDATKYAFKSKGIASMDYDATGNNLVVATETEVAGFHLSRHEPIWRVPATTLGVDTPLKGAAVADGGDGVLVAGRTKVNALRSVLSADVDVAGGLKRTAVPGDTVRYDVTITNTGSAPDTYAFRVQPAPGGWSYDAIAPLTLLPEQTATVKLNVTSPTGASPGYGITKLAIDSQGRQASTRYARDATVATFDLNVTLTRVYNLRVESDTKSLPANQGQETAYTFTVRNLGNSAAEVNLTATQAPSRGPSWKTRFDPAKVVVAPGGAETVTLHVTPPADAGDGDANTITVRANVGTTYHADLVFSARVNPVFKMRVEANTTTVTTTAGAAATVKLTLTNEGNSPDTANLTAIVAPESARLDWRVSLDYDHVEVTRGNSRTVTLTIRATVREPQPAAVTVTMATLNGGERQSVTIEMEQVERAETKGGFFGRIPAPDLPLALLAAAFAAAAVGATRRRPSR